MRLSQAPISGRSFINRLLLTSTTVLLLAAASAAQVSENWQKSPFQWEPITESDWKSPADSFPNRPDAVMLFEKVIDDERLLYYGTIMQRIYTRTRILSEAGRRNSDISFHYREGLDNIVVLQARTTLPDGTVLELTKEDILADEVKVEGSRGGRQVAFSFPGVDSNCIIEYCIGLWQKNAGVPYTYRDRPVQKDMPLLLGEYTWFYADRRGPDETYVDIGICQYAWSGDCGEVTDSAAVLWGDQSITQIVQNVPAWRDEPMSLPEEAARLQIWRYYSKDEPRDFFTKAAESYRRPEPDAYDYGEKDWKEIRKVTERFHSIADREMLVRAVYSWLQDSIANTSYYDTPPDWLRDKKGRQVKKFGRHKHLREVLEKRYGDWRDIDCLFYRMLSDLGIEALPALVVNRADRVFNDEAGCYQFDRFVIAVCDSTGNHNYLAPGEYAMPYGKLHWGYEATDALLCDANPRTVRLPFSPPDGNQAVRILSLDMETDSTITGTLIEQHNGHKGRLCRVHSVGSDPGHVEALLADSLAQILPGADGDIDSVMIPPAVAGPVTVSYSLRFRSAPFDSAAKHTVAPLLFAPDTGNVFTSPDRRNEIAFPSAFRAVDTVFVSLPDGQQVSSLPPDTTIVTDAGACTVTFFIEGDRLVATRDFVLNRPRFPAPEYPEVRALFAARADLSRTQVLLTPGE